MTTYLIMQNRIADELVRDDLSTQIQRAINDAIKTWEGIRLKFNERRYLINTVADTEFYEFTAPTLLLKDGSAVDTGETILELDSVTCTVNNFPYPLNERTEGWFARNATSTYTGQPDSYGIYENQLRIFPVPDAVYPINLAAGLARLGPNPLTADGDTNGWMTEGEPLTRQQAKLIIYRDTLRDQIGVQNASSGIQEAQWMLERKATAQNMTGVQRPWNL
jgi:hypothetical protein